MLIRLDNHGDDKSKMTKRTLWTTAAVLCAAVAVPAGLVAQDNCRHRAEIELNAQATGNLTVDAGAGTLVVSGRDGLDGTRVTATLCASDEGRLEGLDVSLEGDRLDTHYPGSNVGRWFARNRYARIDLVVEVPKGTNLRLEDTSGSVEITGVGDVALRDGSGNALIRGAASAVVQDGSGSLRIEDVADSIMVEDGSGSMRILGVGGSVVITDGSGSIEVGAVSGTVRINGAGSGRVTVRDVAGDLVVTDTRRSRIRYSDIRGSLDLPPERR